MHFIIGLILISIFLGFLFSPKGSDFQTIVRKGFISLLIMIGVLAVIGGIWYGIETYQSNKKKKRERQEQLFREKEIADQKAREKLAEEKKLAQQLKEDSNKIKGSKNTTIPKPKPAMDIMGKWKIETESYAYFTFAQDKEKVTASKFKWFARSGDKLMYTVKGIVDGKSVTFNSNNLRGTLKLRKKSYDRQLIGEVKENGQLKAFVIEED